MSPNLTRAASIAALLGLGACDLSGDFLFADVVDIPAVVHLAPEGEDHWPVNEIATVEDIEASTIYAEVGSPQSAAPGGVTLTFVGTGRDVCVWIDPETAYWNQKVSTKNNSAQSRPWAYPDNVFDDGDLDLYVGLSTYYTGSQGEEMGDFIVSYEDSLGNEIPIEYVACSNRGYGGIANAHAGRGTAEYCTVSDSDLGIPYTIALQTYSAPLDDDRLAFGVLLYDGDCNTLKNVRGASSLPGEECLIQGESMVPDGEDFGPWVGYDASRSWAGVEEFESAFCGEAAVDYCLAEAEAIADEGFRCGWNEVGDDLARCYCGDPNDTPEPGAG